MFHDHSSESQGYDTKTVGAMFAQDAQITGGAILPFDENSLDLVKELLLRSLFTHLKV